MSLDLLAGPVRRRTISARICLADRASAHYEIKRLLVCGLATGVDDPDPRSKAKVILFPRNSYNSAVLTPSASRSLRDLQISSQDAPAAEVF
jgi:hypothetical protein